MFQVPKGVLSLCRVLQKEVGSAGLMYNTLPISWYHDSGLDAIVVLAQDRFF